jgi:tetratricopeptide (TPR) repeat protein
LRSIVNTPIEQLSQQARRAAQARDWRSVKKLAQEVIGRRRNSAEGRFLLGLAEAGMGRWEPATKAFQTAIKLDVNRYDAAIELACLYMELGRFSEAVEMIVRFESLLGNSPMYLDKAARIYINVNLPDAALPLLRKANELQPGIDSLQANLAECLVFVGEIDEAESIYRHLLDKTPDHQRNNYEYARIRRANDDTHIEHMKEVLRRSKRPPEGNVFLYYALGKELEDLERWDEAFDFYKRGGDAARSQLDYDVGDDVAMVDTVIEYCNSDWLQKATAAAKNEQSEKTPVFVVGLPRSGTTLTERILTCHSQVESIGESYFIREAVHKASRARFEEAMSPAIIKAASSKDPAIIARKYLASVAYKFGDKPFFIEKFPENALYLGFIAAAFPDARIILQTRNPMDSCFAMYKQSYFRYAYSLDDLGAYYVAYDRLITHWRETLGDRLVEVNYENMVSNQESETRRMLDELRLDFEEACLHFEKNVTPSNTASTVQVREKAHTRSVRRWTRYKKQLQSLQEHLERAGINTD